MISDQKILEKKLMSPYVNLGSNVYKFSKTIHVWNEADPAYLCRVIEASGPWNQFQFEGAGPAFVFHNLKDSRITGLHVLSGSIVFNTDGSSSRNILTSLRCQNSDMVFEAPNGADMCLYQLNNCETLHGSMIWTGSNNLAPTLINCTASENGVGFDFTQGGSGATLIGCGGSKDDSVIKANGGYQLTVIGGRSELSRKFIEATHDGPTPFTIQGTTLDDVKQIIKGKSKGVKVSNVWHNSKLVDEAIAQQLE